MVGHPEATILFDGRKVTVYGMTDSSGYARLTISDLAASSTPYTITAEYANVKVTNKIYVN